MRIENERVTESKALELNIGANRSHSTRPEPTSPPWLWRLGACALAAALVLGAVGEYLARHAGPMLKRRVVADLAERFHSPVQLDELHLSLLHGLQITGSGLRIWSIAGPARPDAHPELGVPMLAIKHFQFRSGVRGLLLDPTMRITTLYVQGMQLNIPPRQQRDPQLQPNDAIRQGQPRLRFEIDKVVCTDVSLAIETTAPGKAPLVFDIRSIMLKDVGPNKPLRFDATLMNPMPRGLVHSSGNFGPWHDAEPRATPIDGQFSFVPVELGSIRGLAGTLSSTGEYHGTLGQIAVKGASDVPDFKLDVSEGPVAMHHEFDATVDGTSGDTKLNRVRATFLQTILVANGSVLRARDASGGVSGHDIELTVESEQARIEDLLRLGVRTSPPLLRGALSIKTRLSIPHGRVSVSEKMTLQGTFAIRGAVFPNPSWQEMIDKLSERARGRPEQASATQAKVAVSQMGGDFALANAVLVFHDLDYAMPGAKVKLAGQYALDGQMVEFAGTLRTQATASEMLTGWKSLLAMPLDYFLKKNGAGVELPIKVSGTKSAPKFGVDLDKMGFGFLSHHNDPPPRVTKVPQ